MSKTLDLLKVKRKFALLLNTKIEIKDCNFLIKYFIEFDNISIYQYSRFGFVISYLIYYKTQEILAFDEINLIDEFDRYTMEKLILSKLNIDRYYKLAQKYPALFLPIKTLSEINY